MSNVETVSDESVVGAPVTVAEPTMATPVVAPAAPGAVTVTGEGAMGLSESAAETIRKAEKRGAPYRVNADGSVTVFRKDGVTPDSRSGSRKTNDPAAPYGRAPDGTPRKAPGRPSTKTTV